ncbi:hypothetical protein, partial [Gordonia sp. (in: high G+C Gram-positive bacteria)]|uniref:hypothetical protein n=1 Tax=Gordonia sp. (in: high G+C Gram-positive bacteria) TaxID=84139 RepID=UPI0035B3B3E8
LSTPPAFVLSQDQTLHEKMQKPNQPESQRFNTKSSTRKAKPDQNNPQKNWHQKINSSAPRDIKVADTSSKQTI